MNCEPERGMPCSVMFKRAFTQFAMMRETRDRVDFPAGIRFDGCVLQEVFFDPYTQQAKYAIQVPFNEKTWTVHVAQDIVCFFLSS